MVGEAGQPVGDRMKQGGGADIIAGIERGAEHALSGNLMIFALCFALAEIDDDGFTIAPQTFQRRVIQRLFHLVDGLEALHFAAWRQVIEQGPFLATFVEFRIGDQIAVRRDDETFGIA